MANIYPVRNSEEFQRIAALPRWTWNRAQAEKLAEEWSPKLLNAHGKALWDEAATLPHAEREKRLDELARLRTPIRMNYKQALGLYAFCKVWGLVGWLPPGSGKTWLTMAITTMAHKHKQVNNSVLLVMASGVQQTHDDFGKLSEVWQFPAPPQVLTYSWMGQPGNGFRLCGCPICAGAEDEEDGERPDGEGIRPQLLVADECDMLRNDDSSVRRRVARYLSNHADSQMSAFVTGTPVRKSLNNFRPMLLWALKEGAPIPFDYITNVEICAALDGKPRDGVRNSPGALYQFAPGAEHVKDEAERLALVRDGMRRRIVETPGVVAIDEASCDQPLTIKLVQAPDDEVLEEEFYRVKMEGTTKDGWPIADVFSEMRYLTELSVGGYSRWDPRPPEEWALAYKTKNKFVRDAIADSQSRGRRPLDSEKEVFRRYHDHPILRQWKEIAPTFTPNSVFVQMSLSVLMFAAKTIKAEGPCLVWVQHDWVGQRLSDITGIPYYAGKGRTSGGSYIGDADGTESCILSAHANRRQRNLQMFHRNVVVGPEMSNERWEQKICRTHRHLQNNPVSVTIILSGAASVKAVEAALDEATGAYQLTGLTQKLLIANWDWSQVSDYVIDPQTLGDTDKRRARWT